MGSRRGWVVALALALGLAVVSLLSNITSEEQLAGRGDGVLTARLVVSLLVNAGTVWAGLMVLAGWLVARPLGALVAGPVSGVGSLLAHYALGEVTGLMPPDSIETNTAWFVVAAVMGVPLGLVGRLARRRDLVGLLARLVVPVGALAEPLVQGWLTPADDLNQPNALAGLMAGSALVLAGIVGGVLVLRRRDH